MHRRTLSVVVGPRRVELAKVGLAKVGLSHHNNNNTALFVSHCVSSRGILVVFPKAGTLKCGAGALKCARLEFSGCRVKPWRPQSRGFTRQPKNSKHEHLTAPAPPNTTKKTREDQEKEK